MKTWNKKTAMCKHLFLWRINICMQSRMLCCYLIVLGSWPHFYLLRKILRCCWYARNRGQRLLHKGVLKVASSLFWTCCNPCGDDLNSLCFLRCCGFVHYELDTMARGDHSKNLFRSIFPKQWKVIEQEAFLSSPFTPIIRGGSTKDPLKGQASCFLPYFNEENVYAVLRNMVW